jgi:Rod binding domain-containing protein
MTIASGARAGIGNSTPVSELQKRAKAAKDFEALLIGQMLQSVREEGSNWMGSGEDDKASDTAFGLGEQELALALADGGGLGLSKVISSGLEHNP